MMSDEWEPVSAVAVDGRGADEGCPAVETAGWGRPACAGCCTTGVGGYCQPCAMPGWRRLAFVAQPPARGFSPRATSAALPLPPGVSNGSGRWRGREAEERMAVLDRLPTFNQELGGDAAHLGHNLVHDLHRFDDADRLPWLD